MASSPENAQLESVRIDAAGVSEMDQHRPVVFVPRNEVIRLEVSYGSGAERPLVLLLLGVFCAALAVALMLMFVVAITRGGLRIPASLITGFTFVIPAWWFLDLAVRKRWYVKVHTRSGSRKLVFQGTHSQVEIEQFVADAKNRFGYA